ncbi:unnamed protein product [Caretta caretta]
MQCSPEFPGFGHLKRHAQEQLPPYSMVVGVIELSQCPLTACPRMDMLSDVPLLRFSSPGLPAAASLVFALLQWDSAKGDSRPPASIQDTSYNPLSTAKP